MIEVIVVLVPLERQEQLGNVIGVESRGLRGQPGGQIGVANVGDAGVLAQLSGDGGFDVATHLGGQIDDDGARLHALDHLLGDEDGRLLARDQRRGDENVDLFALLGEERHLGGDELRRHFFGVTAGTFARFFDLHLEREEEREERWK